MLAAATDDKDLLTLVAQNDEAAFRRLFNKYWNKIYSAALTLTKSDPIAEEIVQDVFVKIWMKRTELPAVENIEAFLFTVARNHIYNTLRKKTQEQPFVEYLEQFFLEQTALPEQAMLVKETTQLLERAVAQLPPQQQTVYRLSRNEGLDYNAIASQLGISRSTVKNHMTKALQFLRQYLGAHHGETLLILVLAKLLS